MPFHDTLMMTLATWVYHRELANRQMLDALIQATFQQMESLYMQEPADERLKEQYWAIWVGLRCLLVEIETDKLVSEMWFAWALAYITVRPTVQYV